MKLDKAFIGAVSGPMQSTWSAVAYDAAELGCKTYADAFEMVADAGRMQTYGGKDGKAADQLMVAAFDEHGFEKVRAFCKKHVPLSY